MEIPKYCKFNLSFNILKPLFEIKVLEQYVNLKKDQIFDRVLRKMFSFILCAGSWPTWSPGPIRYPWTPRASWNQR